MNIFLIAWRSIQQRGFASLLTTLSMALGVLMVVVVLSIHGVVSKSFQSNSSLGYNMIVGSRGGKLQLTLNSVYYLSQPVENVPYEYYLSFKDKETRQKELPHSIAYRTHQANWSEIDLMLAQQPVLGFGGISSLAANVANDVCQQIDASEMRIDEPGMLSNFSDAAIPLALGDYVGHFRAVGTTPDFFNLLEINVDTGEKYSFSEGRNFVSRSPEHGFFECVIGSGVARELNLGLGDHINPLHGAPTGHTHENGFTVVGIVAPSGTPNDRAVFVNIEGFFLMEDHSKPVDEKPTDLMTPPPVVELSTLDAQNTSSNLPDASKDSAGKDSAGKEATETTVDADSILASNEKSEKTSNGDGVEEAVAEEKAEDGHQHPLPKSPLPIEQREVTAILLRTFDDGFGLSAMKVENLVNEGILENSLTWSQFRPYRAQKSAQAVLPIREIAGLFEIIVKPVQIILLIMTGMICVVSGISILVSIYNSMSERRHEIAVMRALGAARGSVMMIILVESLMLSTGGGILGWTGGHALNALANPYIENQTGVSLGFFDFAPSTEIFALIGISGVRMSPEVVLIPAIVVLSVIVGLFPAISGYRTDVSKSLGK